MATLRRPRNRLVIGTVVSVLFSLGLVSIVWRIYRSGGLVVAFLGQAVSIYLLMIMTGVGVLTLAVLLYRGWTTSKRRRRPT